MNEVEARSGTLVARMDARQVHQLDHDVVAVGREEMHLPSGVFGQADEAREFVHRPRFGNAALIGHIAHRGDRPCPDDVVDIDVVADERLHTALAVDDECQSVAMLSGEVEKRAVLAIFVSVGRVVVRAFVVAHQYDDTVAYQLAQLRTTLNVCVRRKKHNKWYFKTIY